MKKEIEEDLMNFYEQYLYFKDVYCTALDSSLAEGLSDKGNNYFLIANSACIESYMMTLARLFDEDGKSATLRSLINKCKKNKDLFDHPDAVFDYLTEAGRKLKSDELKHATEVIRHRRNHYFAHNDLAYFAHSNPDDLAVIDDKHLKDYEIWMLARFVEELLKKLMSELGVDYTDMQLKYNRDLADLVPNIKDRQISPI